MDITRLLAAVNGESRGVDLTANTPVVLSIKIGGGTNTELTKTILDHLVNLQNGTDFSNGTNSHTHDGRYYTQTQIGSTTGGSAGSTLVGDNNSYSNFTPTAATVKGALAGIDAALAGTGGTQLDGTFKIENTADPTKIMNFDVSGVSTATTRTLKMANANVDLANLTNSNIAAAAAIALTKLAALSNHNRALVSDNSGFITESAVTSTELGYVSGVTSAIQTQLNATEKTANKGAANGYAPLDSGGKVPYANLPSALMTFKGAWDASTNTPTLADGTGTTGDVYRASVAGTQNLGSGSQTWAIGDFAIYNGTIWQHSPAADGVSSVNGATGAVTVNAINQLTGDVTAGPASGSQSQAATIAAGAVTASKLGTVTDGVTLDQSGAGSTLEVKTGGITNTQISASAAIAYSKLNLSNSIVNADIATGAAIAYSKLNLSNAILASDLTTGVFDQVTITGGNGSAGAVQSAPAVKAVFVAGQTFSANTSYAVRLGVTANGETAGRIYAADPDTSSFDLFYVIGMISGGAGFTAGQNVTVTRIGAFSLSSSDSAFGSGTDGAPVFLSTGGALTTTAPSSAGSAITRVGMVKVRSATPASNIVDVSPQTILVN